MTKIGIFFKFIIVIPIFLPISLIPLRNRKNILNRTIKHLHRGHNRPKTGQKWPKMAKIRIFFKLVVVIRNFFANWVYFSYFWVEWARLAKKIGITTISLKKMPILIILGHFWPVFGLLWPRCECWKVLTSIFFLVLSGMSEICKKISNNDDQFEKNADFGHFKPFLACFWPVLFPECVFNGLFEYIFPSSEWNEWDWQKNSK